MLSFCLLDFAPAFPGYVESAGGPLKFGLKLFMRGREGAEKDKVQSASSPSSASEPNFAASRSVLCLCQWTGKGGGGLDSSVQHRNNFLSQFMWKASEKGICMCWLGTLARGEGDNYQ